MPGIFQLPFRDSRAPARKKRTRSAFNSLFGIRDREEQAHRRHLPGFQLPFRDSRSALPLQYRYDDFQLPFRDSVSESPLRPPERKAFNSLFGIPLQAPSTPSSPSSLSTPFSGFYPHILLNTHSYMFLSTPFSGFERGNKRRKDPRKLSTPFSGFQYLSRDTGNLH